VDGIRLTPDLVIVHSGINDVRNAQHPDLADPPDPRTLIWEQVMQQMREESKHGPSLWTLTRHYSYLARMPGYVLELLRQRQGLHSIQVTEPHDSAIEYFTINLVRTIALASNAQAAIVLSTPPSALNMRNKPSDPIEKSYWIKDAGTTEAYRRRLGARMEEIAQQERALGRRVGHVAHSLRLEQFLDDAHLTSAGNKTVAQNLVAAATRYLPARLNGQGGKELRCPGS
jgi:hypothetical protein